MMVVTPEPLTHEIWRFGQQYHPFRQLLDANLPMSIKRPLLPLLLLTGLVALLFYPFAQPGVAGSDDITGFCPATGKEDRSAHSPMVTTTH